ncbi:hypothetical protein AWT69_004963 [Pseudomonas putida]|nr:hypothetical protein AWT69_004963 [Pseudomonas putida]
MTVVFCRSLAAEFERDMTVGRDAGGVTWERASPLPRAAQAAIRPQA